MSNRLITPNKQLVDASGSAVSSKPIEVTFQKQIRIVVDKNAQRGIPLNFTHVMCDGRCVAWMVDVPKPPNYNGPLDLVVWGYFCPAGEVTLQSGIDRQKAMANATEFARKLVTMEIEESAAG